jgi:hypothetical protein
VAGADGGGENEDTGHGGRVTWRNGPGVWRIGAARERGLSITVWRLGTLKKEDAACGARLW